MGKARCFPCQSLCVVMHYITSWLLQLLEAWREDAGPYPPLLGWRTCPGLSQTLQTTVAPQKRGRMDKIMQHGVRRALDHAPWCHFFSHHSLLASEKERPIQVAVVAEQLGLKAVSSTVVLEWVAFGLQEWWHTKFLSSCTQYVIILQLDGLNQLVWLVALIPVHYSCQPLHQGVGSMSEWLSFCADFMASLWQISAISWGNLVDSGSSWMCTFYSKTNKII